LYGQDEQPQDADMSAVFIAPGSDLALIEWGDFVIKERECR
jgi:hypothetical protein